jgi:hypothetical protein
MAASKKIGSVLLDKVNIDVVKTYLEKYGLPVDGTDVELVTRLVGHQAKVPKSHIGDCDNCKGACDVREPVCVYCGIGDDDEAQVAEAVASNPNATIEPVTPAKSRKSRSDVAKPIPAEEPAPSLTKVVAPVDILSPSVKSASMAVTDGELAQVTLAKLDDNVAQIHMLRRDAIVSYWRLGRAIFDNYRLKLYTQRLDESGVPIHKAFNHFVVSELKLSVSHAYALMDVAVNFTEEEVATVGVSKLTLIARLPAPDRSELLRKIREQNTPLSQVADEVRRLAGGKRAESAAEKGGGKGFGGDAAKGRASQQAVRQITVGLYLGKQTIGMMRRDAPDREASTLAHEPWCEELHVNGVKTKYQILKTETGLALVITRTRDAAAAKSESDTPKKKQASKIRAEKKESDELKPPGKKRGRKPGSKNKPKDPTVATSSTGKSKPAKSKK